jgi:hypothetical protein
MKWSRPLFACFLICLVSVTAFAESGEQSGPIVRFRTLAKVTWSLFQRRPILMVSIN